METVAPGVYRIRLGYVSAYVVDGDEGVTLVDTGLPKKEGAILGALSSVGRSASEITAIVITHAHVDHVGSAAAMKRESGASLFASAVDAPAVRGEVAKPLPPFLDRVPFLKPVVRRLPDAAGVAVEGHLVEGAAAALPGDLRVVETPGHTPGHLSYHLDRDGGVLFVGDAAIRTRRGDIKRGWMNRSTPQFDDSLRHIAEFDFEVACFGHAAPIASAASAAFRRFVASMS